MKAPQTRRAALLCAAALIGLMAGGQAQAALAIRAPFGTSKTGETVEQITLRNNNGMIVRISTRGASLMEVSAPDRNGALNNVVVSLQNFEAWENAGTFNAVIGRYANRIDKGGFTLDGTTYKLAGANASGVVSHGGPGAFQTRIWKAETASAERAASATLSLTSADGDNGFPGQLEVKVTYTLDNRNVLRIDYEATTSKPTVVNLTNHAFFNIGGFDSGPVYDQRLQVMASRYLPADARLVPTGEIAPVDGTPFDFRQPSRLGDRIYATHQQIQYGRGIDHNLVLDKPAGEAFPVAARIYDPKSGRQMEVRTTEPGVQIFTANNWNGTLIGQGGRNLRISDGITFETQHYPDSPNRPNFPSTELRPGQTFRSATEFAFGADNKPIF
jgi:aldose 1-epimerase